jgi:hypothetical protein
MATFDPDNINRAIWKFYMKVIQVIIENEGKIFGGAVRDIYSRHYYAGQFYNKYGTRDLDGKNWEYKKYTDATFCPETKDRFSLPKDIDACIKNDKLQNVLRILHLNHFKVHTIFSRDAKKYLPNIFVEEGEVTHYRIKIKPDIFIRMEIPNIMRDILAPQFNYLIEQSRMINQQMGYITLDLMVNMTDRDIDPPYGNLDFECNGLILTQDGIRLSRCLRPASAYKDSIYPLQISEKLHDVQKDIIAKRAIPVPSNCIMDSTYRISKMLSKGYTIVYLTIEKNISIDETQTCIICHEDINQMNHVKLKCCNARYHPNCLVRAAFMGQTAIYSTNRCIMCRQQLCKQAHTELDIFRQQYLCQQRMLMTSRPITPISLPALLSSQLSSMDTVD